ncbi:hypothetical protein [Rhodanobacter lindaniclasticus]
MALTIAMAIGASCASWLRLCAVTVTLPSSVACTAGGSVAVSCANASGAAPREPAASAQTMPAARRCWNKRMR